MRIEQEAPPRHRIAASAFAVFVSLAPVGAAQERVSLDAALREARAANAHLPLPALQVTIAGERQSEARAERWLKVAVEGDFLYAPASGYSPVLTNLGDARFQVVARQPLYAGGAIKAGADRAGAGVEAARARYRMAEGDLELEVRSRFSELEESSLEVAIRREGIERLKTYATSLRSRQASGQGVAADLLKTEVRAALEEATLAETEQRRDDTRLALNELMGRDPAAPLELEPLPPPEPPSETDPAAWQGAPEVIAAEADTRSAEAATTIARAERLPHLFFTADAGFWTADTTSLGAHFWDRLWRDGGYSLSLVFVWPVWDPGAARARIAQADLGLREARLQLNAQRRDARLNWERAQTAMRHLHRQIEILSRAVPDARDSYLQAESRYRGGTATALEVLDANAASVEGAVRRIEVIARYRVARAVALRWSTP